MAGGLWPVIYSYYNPISHHQLIFLSVYVSSDKLQITNCSPRQSRTVLPRENRGYKGANKRSKLKCKWRSTQWGGWMLLLSMMTLLHYHITNISRLLSDQSFPTQLGNNLVYFIYRSGSHNLSRRHTSSEWGPSHPQGADNWSSFLLFGDNWKISISLRLNSTVSSNEPIECQEGEQT